jgi:SAM-dependent methyltransferase
MRASAASRLFAVACGLLPLVLLALQPARAQDEQPPFVVTPTRVIDRMFALAQVGADDYVIDLGSGDGRIVIQAAKRFGARGLGVEMNASLVAASRAAAEREGIADRVRFEHADALATDLRPATVLTVYLSPQLNERLLPRILADMRPGSRVVSHDFAIGNWMPERTERLDVPEKNNGRGGESVLMLWVVPANAAGRWRGTIGAGESSRELEFSLAQQFQFLEAGLHAWGGEPLAFAARLSGARITLQLPARGPVAPGEVSASINADVMTGTWVGANGARAPFQARRIAARPDLY